MSAKKYLIFIAILIGATACIFPSQSLAMHPDAKITVELKLGQARTITTPIPFKRVAIADEEVADIVVLSPSEAYIYGKQLGFTSVVLWDEEGKGKTMFDVAVSLDLSDLKEKIFHLFPGQQIEVHGSETGIVLSGIVSGPEIVEQAVRLALAYLPKIAEEGGKLQEWGAGKSGQEYRVTNLLKVSGIQQVMLEVKFAEVNRTSQKDIQAGIAQGGLSDLTGHIGVESVLTPLELTGSELLHLPGNVIGSVEDVMSKALVQGRDTLFLNLAGAEPNIFVNIKNFTASLKLLESEGLARILAEPHLVTLSGHEASFLAGGEFPIPIYDDGSIVIEFKEFGVGLVFTPHILSNGKISLHVSPSVSEIASSSVIPAGIEGANFVVPNLATRKLDTTVELFDGQSLALAGLLQNSLRETVVKIPGLADIPILGSLFRSSSYQQNKTDLLIAVTPRLVKPVKPEDITMPGENIIPPSGYEFYLEGKLEGDRTAKIAGSGGLEGDHGHQPARAE